MEVQIGNPVVRNNLIILDGPIPYPADDSLHHVNQRKNWYYQINNPDTVYFQETAAGNGDPDLVNLTGGDYHLSPQSPLKMKGMNLSEFYSIDFKGDSLKKSGGWDIGAFQSQVDN
jgi:hypothetical protein